MSGGGAAASGQHDRNARRARRALIALFAINGAGVASWLPRIPEVQQHLGLTEGALGLALAGLPAGGTAAALAIGPLLAAVGTRGPLLAGSLAVCATLVLPGLAPTGLLLGLGLLVLGAADGTMDVAMNGHAIAVQRRVGRPILNGLHACWSAGALAGTLGGSAAAGLGVPVTAHLAATGGTLALAVLVAQRTLLPRAADRPPAGTRRIVRASPALALVITAAVAAALVEGVPADWSAVHLATTLGTPAGLVGAGYAAFAALHLAGRLVGDPVVRRWGSGRVLRTGAALGTAGLLLAAMAAHPAVAVAGFGLLGLGAATIVPAVFAAAGHLPGVPAGQGIALASLAGRGGMIVGPPLIGAVAVASDLRVGLALAAGVCALLVVLPSLERVEESAGQGV